ncbi:large conductance mechanosensitive channel protein MscL [Sutcliffiella halmapala]
MWNDFKKFALKGNVLDLAIGVIIGAAFGKIVTSLVNDIIMPMIGLIMGGVDLSDLHLKVGDAVLAYGNFIQTVLDFIIVGFSIFMFIKLFNRLKKKEEKVITEPPKPTKEEELLTEIRDLLKK